MGERKQMTGRDPIESEPEHCLIVAAVNVVDMFDQANTGHTIEKMGDGRGMLLKDAISKLRRNLNSDKQRTTLDSKQVGE